MDGNWGTAPDAELEAPRSPAFLAFRRSTTGSTLLIAYGADQEELARRQAKQNGWTVVRVPVVFDCTPVDPGE